MEEVQQVETFDLLENSESILRKAETKGFNEEEKDILQKVLECIRNCPDKIPPNLRYFDRKKVKIAVGKINKVISIISTETISETNLVIRAAANTVADILGYKSRESTNKKEPYWRKRIVDKQKKLRKDLGQVNRMKRNELRNEAVKERLERLYYIKKKGIDTVYEELNQRIVAVGAKLKRYDNRIEQFRQNRLFESNRKKLFDELEGKTKETIVPDAEQSREFWSEIWDKPLKHNENAEWLKTVERDIGDMGVQENIKIDLNKIKKQLNKMPNWKSPGPDGVQGYWLKNLSSFHEKLAEQLDRCLQENKVPKWMVTGKTLLCVKEIEKGNVVSNFRPITCLPLLWKLLTAVLAEDIYNHLEIKNLLPVEQKGCRKRSRGTKDQLLIDKMIIRNCKKRLTGLGIAWIDYRKAYDMVPHSWIDKSMELFGVAGNVRGLISGSMKQWNTELTAGDQPLGNVNIRRGIFQGDSLSPLLFVIALIPLSLLLKKTKIFYELGKQKEKVNHLLFMDDLKLFAKNENQLDSLVNVVRIFSNDIKMEFGLSKCAVLIMKGGKFFKSDGISMPNGDVMDAIEEGACYKYLGILEADGIKNHEMKSQISKTYFRRVRNILKSKLNGGNIISSINSRAVSVIRYGAGVIKWTKLELQDLDRKTRKIMTMYGAHHPKADVDRLYIKRADGGRGLIGVEDCVRMEINSLKEYVQNADEELMIAVNRENILGTGSYEKDKNGIQEEHKTASKNKALHGQFSRATDKSRGSKSWDWLKKGYLKKETESTIFAAQDQALATNNLRKVVYGENISSLCRVCGLFDETVAHIVSECPKLAQREYKVWRHDQVARIIHWKLCEKWGFDRGEKWYTHKPESVLESDCCKILWDFPIQTDKKLEHNRPDITVIEKKKKICQLIDPSCPFDTRIEKKEDEKLINYENLKYEIARIWQMKKVDIIPIVIGGLGTVTKNLEKWVKKIEIDCTIELLQKACLLGSARIIRKVLDMK